MYKNKLLLNLLTLTTMCFLGTGCKKEPAAILTNNCIISGFSTNSDSVAISYDNQHRITRVDYLAAPRDSYKITYSDQQRITETDSGGANYIKKIYSLNAEGKPINIKSYYQALNSSQFTEEWITWIGNEIATDSSITNGAAPVVTSYYWVNGNLVKTYNRYVTEIFQYDMSKPGTAGDYFWMKNQILNEGLFNTSTNLLVSYQSTGADGNVKNYYIQSVFDASGRIVSIKEDGTTVTKFAYRCN